MPPRKRKESKWAMEVKESLAQEKDRTHEHHIHIRNQILVRRCRRCERIGMHLPRTSPNLRDPRAQEGAV